MIEKPHFASLAEKFKFHKDNKRILIAEKKASTKHADAVSYSVPLQTTKDGVAKDMPANTPVVDISCINVKAAINTTNLLDSHGDVHINGLWKKSLSETKGVFLLQEHIMKFNSIISREVTPYTKQMTFAELGFPEYGEAKTEVLIFDAEIDKDDSDCANYMFGQYAKGYVTNHSVGMQYVTLLLCINSDDKYYAEEKANWNKYIGRVANQQDAIDEGMFWAVTEAKLIEGSAVVVGSNFVTPTISVTPENKNETDKFIKLENQIKSLQDTIATLAPKQTTQAVKSSIWQSINKSLN